ncbi:hypothetical protein UO65_2768 [Actinokineospora spheciospongiae]|uniref:Uncharacterized protein n=1 Tax=Actinokineospora spheciospongiae TaxID=909613 RepID=W7J7B8_9PSEU|nr:hypothetical protein UO65_2768 [Actinokineospora spheciospongiae]
MGTPVASYPSGKEKGGRVGSADRGKCPHQQGRITGWLPVEPSADEKLMNCAPAPIWCGTSTENFLHDLSLSGEFPTHGLGN